MIDKQFQRKTLDILEEMCRDIENATSLKKMRPITEYLSVFRQMEEICRRDLSPERQAAYRKCLHPLIASMERLERKRGTDKKKLVSCRRLIHQLCEQLREEQEVKKAMVFLPYNASMWDSMEGVWKAAMADKEHCSPYVVPLPYYDKNPDGTFKEQHCDIDRFPKEVPVIDWRTIDLEKLHPDIIIIHDPYDDTNHITTIDPKYYAKNLRKWTDKLVYIPYFVFPEPDLNNQRVCNYIGGFAKQMGVALSNLTIVQSEAVREAYIRALLPPTTPLERSYWEKHILALGSPKIDKVRNLKKEDFSLPEDWRRIIEGKKVILYNTSVTDVVHITNLFLPKIRDVLAVFRASKEVVLWWRPHPLLESTIQRMCPEILSEYRELVKEYREGGWGIYDDTSDMHRSIAFSDAFYGDGSSMAVLYRMTGKPVLVQNYKVLCNAPPPVAK